MSPCHFSEIPKKTQILWANEVEVQVAVTPLCLTAVSPLVFIYNTDWLAYSWQVATVHACNRDQSQHVSVKFHAILWETSFCIAGKKEGPQLCYGSGFGAVLLRRSHPSPLPWPTAASVSVVRRDCIATSGGQVSLTAYGRVCCGPVKEATVYRRGRCSFWGEKRRKPWGKEHLDLRGQVKLTLRCLLKGSQNTHNLPPDISLTP